MSAGKDDPHPQKGSVDKATPPDQRRFRRYGVKLQGRIKPRVSPTATVLPELEVETLDVSSGGLFFLTSTKWTIGTAIEFELDLPALDGPKPAKVRCRGTITRVVPQKKGRVGIGATIDSYKFSSSKAKVR